MEHRSPKTLEKTTVLARAIRKYGLDQFDFEIVEICKESELNEMERHYIQLLKPAYNMNEGGLGNCGYMMNQEVKRILSEKAKQQWNDKSEEEKLIVLKQNLIGPKIGHSVSLETRKKLRDKNLGKKQSGQTVMKRTEKLKRIMVGNQNGNKKVAQINPCNGSVIGEFDSIVQAAKHLNIAPSGITEVCTGVRNTCAGYWWKHIM